MRKQVDCRWTRCIFFSTRFSACPVKSALFLCVLKIYVTKVNSGRTWLRRVLGTGCASTRASCSCTVASECRCRAHSTLHTRCMHCFSRRAAREPTVGLTRLRAITEAPCAPSQTSVATRTYWWRVVVCSVPSEGMQPSSAFSGIGPRMAKIWDYESSGKIAAVANPNAPSGRASKGYFGFWWHSLKAVLVVVVRSRCGGFGCR